MLGKLVKAGILIVIAAIVVQSLPDLKRYLKLRNM